MRVTVVLVFALLLDAFILFGVPYMLPADPGAGAISDRPLSKFITGNYSDPDTLELKYENAPEWVNLLTNIPIIGEFMASTVSGVTLFMGLVADFGVLIMGLILFPFTLSRLYGLQVAYSVIFGVLYYAINLTALLQLVAGRAT